MEKQISELLQIDTIRLLRIKVIILLLNLIFFCSCAVQSISEIQKKIPDFNSKEWKLDSLSCQDKRPLLYKILLKNKDIVMNRSKKTIISLLGVPNTIFNNQNSFAYFIGDGLQCWNKNYRDYSDLQTKVLILDFKGDTLFDIHVIQP